MRHFTRPLAPRRISVTLGLALALAPTAAQAGPPSGDAPDDAVTVQAPQRWAAELDTTALASYLRPGDQAVLVIAAGDGNELLDAAKDTLEQQLRAHPRRLRVAGARWRGQSSQDDQQIVTRAKTSPFRPDVVMLARLFDDELIVTIYDLDGTVVDGFIVTRGRALQVRPESSEAGGLTEQAADAVAEVIDEQPVTPPADAVAEEIREAYNDQYFHFQKVVMLNPWTAEISTHESDRVVRGDSNTPMSYEQALRAMGQTELARDVHRRKGTKFALVFSGAFLAVGLPVGGSLLLFAEGDPQLRTGGAVGVAVGITGAAMIITGLALPKLVNKEIMRGHMNTYNSGLRAQLKHSNLSFGQSVRETWSLSPTVSRTGASLSFSARF